MPVWNCDITSPDDMPVLGRSAATNKTSELQSRIQNRSTDALCISFSESASLVARSQTNEPLWHGGVWLWAFA
eukprot:386316-Amphidinium_carterae.1